MAIFTSSATSVDSSAVVTAFNPNLRLEYGQAAVGEDVLKASC